MRGSPKKQRGCISRQECIIRLPWVDRDRAGYFVSGHTVAFRTFKADMADTLRRLTNTSSFSALQGKLESWHRDYRVSLLILNRRPKSQQRSIRQLSDKGYNELVIINSLYVCNDEVKFHDFGQPFYNEYCFLCFCLLPVSRRLHTISSSSLSRLDIAKQALCCRLHINILIIR